MRSAWPSRLTYKAVEETRDEETLKPAPLASV